MPGPRVSVLGTVPSLEPEDDPGIHFSGQAWACGWIAGSSQVEPGNDSQSSVSSCPSGASDLPRIPSLRLDGVTARAVTYVEAGRPHHSAIRGRQALIPDAGE